MGVWYWTGGKDLLVCTLLLRVQDAETRDGGEEDDGAAGAGGDHVPGAGLGYEERAGQVDVEELAEQGGVVGFGFDVGAFSGCNSVTILELLGEMGTDDTGGQMDRGTEGYMDGALTYSTIPAELITMSTEPRSDTILATTSAMAFASRTSTL